MNNRRWNRALNALVSVCVVVFLVAGNTFSVKGADRQPLPTVSANVIQPMDTDAEIGTGDEAEEPEVLHVIVPNNVSMMLNPYRLDGKEQIYSQDIVLTNKSGFAIESRLELLFYEVSRAEQEQGIKDCKIVLYRKDSDFAYELSEGGQENVDMVSIPDQESLHYYFKGNIKEGSEAMWHAEDVSLRMIFRFQKQQNKTAE